MEANTCPLIDLDPILFNSPEGQRITDTLFAEVVDGNLLINFRGPTKVTELKIGTTHGDKFTLSYSTDGETFTDFPKELQSSYADEGVGSVLWPPLKDVSHIQLTVKGDFEPDFTLLIVRACVSAGEP